MNLILFCVFLTFSIGLFLLLAGLLRLPTLKTSRVMMDTGKEGKQLSKTLDAFYMDGAVKIAKYIRMNDYKKNRMANVLRASGLGMTPEVYTAYAYLKAGSVFLLIIPALHVFPLAALFVILLGIMIYYKEIQKADEMLKEKREQIEEELYRFVSTITQELKNSRDVLSMLEHYKENAGAAFRKELDIVCADMRSSSYEAALTRFEARLNSPQLSDAMESAVISTVNDNYNEVYHSVREGYAAGYEPDGESFSPSVDYGDIYSRMCFLLGLEEDGAGYVRINNGGEMEYRLSNLSVYIHNNALGAGGGPYYADASIRLEVPVRFTGKIITNMSINLKVRAAYTEKF